MKKICIALMAPVLSGSILVAACTKRGPVRIDPEGWHGSNAQIISRMIETHGKVGAAYDSKNPPVAAFDLDNTIIKNDVGDGLLFWMIANNKILQPQEGDWLRTSPLLTKSAAEDLGRACGPQGEPGRPMITNRADPASIACADEIYSIYDSGKTTVGADAWREGAHSETIEPSYAWAVALQAGYTPGEIRGFAEQAIDFNLGNEIGAVQSIGSNRGVVAYVRIYDQMRGLISALGAAGFDVRVISASSQPLVEATAGRVGIPASQAIGVRALLDEEGRATASFQGCGPHGDGNYGIISYRQGKRCWLNKVVFGSSDPASQMNDKSPILFAAGDSDNDLIFLKDSAYRLVINRNRTELMCHAYAGLERGDPADGVWLINPMFIEPRPKRQSPYDCARYGLPDQIDSVYAL